MAKSLGSYKGFRGFYEFDLTGLGSVDIVIYRNGYVFKPVVEIGADSEQEAIYEFRRAIDLRLKHVERYPDLEDRRTNTNTPKLSRD